MSELVWYAAYGSNLSRARFDFYLRGGTPEGASHDYPGCRDPSAPVDDRSGEIAPELAFGGTSRTWGGGVAFVNPDSSLGAKARFYLITLEQLADVVAQENWLEPESVALRNDLDEVDLGASLMYGLVVSIGEMDDCPILTFTQHRGTATSKPSLAYLSHIARGLREAHRMSDDEIVDYLIARPGIESAFSLLTLRATLGTVDA